MQNWNYITRQDNVYKIFDLPIYNVMDEIPVPCGKLVTKNTGRKKNTQEYHLNIPMAFDIETAPYDYYLDGETVERRAMFVWQFAFGMKWGVMGRTWEGFAKLLQILNSGEVHLHIFVHNLTYETYHMIQILSNILKGDWKVKLLNSMKVWEVQWGNIHFHDSAVISMMSLERTANDYNKIFYKMKGDFDYNKKFNINSVLSQKEIGYCLGDVFSLTEYITRMLEMYPMYNLIELPKTQTGFVRKDVLRKSLQVKKWRQQFLKMSLTTEEYEACIKAFDGGYTAGSISHYAEFILDNNIKCRDITSSYPFQLLRGLYPMNKFSHYKWEDFEGWEDYAQTIKDKAVIAKYTFTNVHLMCKEPRFSISRLDELGDYEDWNGKLISCEHMTRVMNEVTFMSFIKYYSFDEIAVDDIMVADKDHLPSWLIESNLDYFRAKSTLKGVDGKEIEYMKGKQMLNGIYGMIATAIVREEWNLNISLMECSKTAPVIDESLDKFYKSENSYLCYQWASYCTAYARQQVFDMMDICLGVSAYNTPNTPQIEGGNWLYTDTDSVYYISNPEIEEAFECYNNSLPRNWQEKTSKGKLTTLGEVTPDGDYCEFVQYGAKKYCKREYHGTRGELVITVAGVPKKTGTKVLKDNIFNFVPGLIFRGVDTGKLRPQYNFMEPTTINVNGVPTLTASSINLMPCDYQLSGIEDDPVEIIDNIIRNINKWSTPIQRKEFGIA